MNIRKLTTWQEWLEAERVTSISFLLKFNKEKSRKKYMDQADGKQPRTEEAWGSFLEDGTMTSSLKVYHHRQIFDGKEVDCGELDMVCSLPEVRESGNIRSLIQAVFDELMEKGFVFSFLHPFSFSYYRQFGYELCSSPMLQKIPLTELKDFPCGYKAKMVENNDDLKIARALYQHFILDKNLSFTRQESDWRLRDEGDFGPIDFFNTRKTKYTYIFFDEANCSRGYLKFFFEPTQSVFIGNLNVDELVYDSPEAFLNIMGFIYKMRAKCETFSFELPEKIDMAALIPNGDNAERSHSSHSMSRILDVKKALELMHHPKDTGSYVLEVKDEFLPHNSGFYTVSYSDGSALSVIHASTGEADMKVSVQTLCQMVLGLTDLNTASYRQGSRIYSNRETLNKVFIEKKISPQ